MIGRSHMRVLGGLVLAAGVAAGSGAAFAHPGPKHGKPAQTGPTTTRTKTAPGHARPAHLQVTGSIAGIGSGTLSVQTSSGTVTVTFDSTTHVTRITSATAADLGNAHVNLHFAKGTTTVDAIRILPARGKPAPTATRTAPGHPGKDHPGKHHPTVTLTGTPTAPVHRPKVIHNGTVTGSTGTTITIQGRGGQTATYTFAGTLSITKQTAGTTNDFKVGQTISAHGPASGPAQEIVILKG